MSDLREQVAQLRGQVDEARHAADQALGEAEAVRRAPAAPSPPAQPRPSELQTPAPTPGPGGGAGAGASIDEEVPSGGGKEVEDYEAAFRLYRAGDYKAAIDKFQAFIQAHPRSDYADNALFWMGESYFKLNDFEQAAVAFDRVVKRFPKGNKVPDALYRQGVSLQEIGQRTGQQSTYGPAACQIFRRITDEYPNSERVAEARRQLEKCPS